MNCIKNRQLRFEQWFFDWGVQPANQSKYKLALSDTQSKLSYYAANPIGGGAQNINQALYPTMTVYEFDDPVALKRLFDDCTKGNVRDDGAMHTAVGYYAMWLRLMDPEKWMNVPAWAGDAGDREVTMRSRGKDYQTALKNRKATYKMDKYLSAIRTKPFVLLAGISGTGKSRLVRQLARGCCPEWTDAAKTTKHPLWNKQKPGNYEMIPVRPNWHDSTELMGYVTRLTEDNRPKYVIKPFVKFLVKAAIWKEVPFFLCLDEMNLAPVEQYFAEYLSVVETRKKDGGDIVSDVLVNFDQPEIDVAKTVQELMSDWIAVSADGTVSEKITGAKAVYDAIVADKGVRIPKNFVVMGTVNMDETTCSFSRKVLDRAMTFELNEVNMDEGLATDNSIPYGAIQPSAAFATAVEGFDFYAANQAVCDKIKTYLNAINAVLDGTPFKFAYRSRNEIMLYCIERMKSGVVELPQALDEATSMKILSRIEGDEQRFAHFKLDEFRQTVCLELLRIDNANVTPTDVTNFLNDPQKCKASPSISKLGRMAEDLANGAGFVSFWEC